MFGFVSVNVKHSEEKADSFFLKKWLGFIRTQDLKNKQEMLLLYSLAKTNEYTGIKAKAFPEKKNKLAHGALRLDCRFSSFN